jgi:hypothetical protein
MVQLKGYYAVGYRDIAHLAEVENAANLADDF